MNYSEFKETIKNSILNWLPSEYENSEVNIIATVKNNDTVLDGMTIRKENSNATPAIYLNSYYEEYKSGREMNDILQEISDTYINTMQNVNFKMWDIKNWEKCRENVIARVFNCKTNEQFLKDKPYSKVEDLAVVYYLVINHDFSGTAVAAINNELLDSYGISMEELHKTAMENNEKLFPSTLFSMNEMMQQLGVIDVNLLNENLSDIPMYILTNEIQQYGAIGMLDKKVMDMVADFTGGDFFVLPSSLHEVIVIPKTEDWYYKELENMVKEINMTQVAPEERLSDHVYEYDTKKHELTRSDKAAKQKEEILKAFERTVRKPGRRI